MEWDAQSGFGDGQGLDETMAGPGAQNAEAQPVEAIGPGSKIAQSAQPDQSGFVFAIVNTDSNSEVATFQDGDALDLSGLPARFRGITADFVGDGVAGDDDGSIQFSLYDADGNLVERRTENGAPFALFGDRNGDFIDPDAPLVDGSYRL